MSSLGLGFGVWARVRLRASVRELEGINRGAPGGAQARWRSFVGGCSNLIVWPCRIEPAELSLPSWPRRVEPGELGPSNWAWRIGPVELSLPNLRCSILILFSNSISGYKGACKRIY